MAITRTAMVDDDGSGTTGTIINNAWKTELYNQIDAADAAVGGVTTGTWLPTLEGDGGPPTGQTYGTRSGTWIRVGPLMTITGRIALSAKGTLTGSKILLGNLPVIAAGDGVLSIPFFLFLGGNIAHLGGTMSAGSTKVGLFYTAVPSPSVADLPLSYVTDTAFLIFGGTYQV